MKIRSPRHLTWLMPLLALLILCLLTACDGGGTVEPPLTSDTAADTPADPVPTDGEITAPDTPSETTAESTSDGETTPAEETTTAPDTTIRLAVMSDVHIGKSNLSVDPAVKLAAALDTVNRVLGTPDAILFAGDLTDLGTDAQYRELNKILGEHVSEDTVICAVMGNHEYFRDGVVRYGGESEAFLKECQDAYKSAVGDLHTDTVVGGMHVISLSTLNSAADYTAATAFL